ncbi:acyl carrier protein [Pendulispora albinea]|uniref:Acyl carrier protein n=1 Tax=Pendulispora albinea TaxID=2741071 RepID=A0ABZ2M681_9BACT
MASENDILSVVREIVRGTLKGDMLEDDADIFDAGATSLTVVDLQLQLEERLNRRAPTHRLMASPSIQGWATIYSSAQAGPAT